MKTIITTAVGAAVTLGALGLPAYGAETAPTQEPKTCVSLARVDYTHVVDDQNILFYTYGGNIYLNRLSHPAPGLDHNRPFLHRTRVSQLCENDIITVLEDWGFGFSPGASTTLGKFRPIDEQQAAAIRRDGIGSAELEPVESK